MAIVGTPFTDTGAQDGEVELVEWFTDREIRFIVNANSERRNDVAEFAVIFFFDNVHAVAILNGFEVIVFGEVEKPFGQDVIWEIELIGRIELNICHEDSSFEQR